MPIKGCFHLGSVDSISCTIKLVESVTGTKSSGLAVKPREQKLVLHQIC